MTRRGEWAAATLVGAATSATLALANRRVVRGYFPLADEWAILAHSHPQHRDLRSWYTEGFRYYFTPPAGLPTPLGTTFSRPLFNATYWAVGKNAGPASGRYVHIGHAAVGACAGVTTLGVLRAGRPLSAAIGSGAVVPLMPAMVPTLSFTVYPCMAFDAAVAALTQTASMAFDRGHPRTAAALLLAGVLTKETALPSAGTLPALYALQQRHALLRDGKARRRLAMLAAPAGIWYALRRAAFSDITVKESAYVLVDDPRGRIARQAQIASKFPFWSKYSSLREPGLTLNKVAAGAHLLANGLVVGGSAREIFSRLRSERRLTTDEASLLATYAFMLAVGTNPRYGAGLDVSLLTNLGRWRKTRGRSSRGARAVKAGLTIGLAAEVALLARDYPRLQRNFLAYADVGRKFVAALRTFGQGERVLVLNDPVTFWVPIHWLTKTLNIDADVVKLADYPWSPDHLEGIWNTSPIDLQSPSTPGGRWRFTQSGSVDILCSYPLLSTDQTVHIDYGDGITVDLEPLPESERPPKDHPRWESMTFTTGDRPAHLLYYDPSAGDFVTVAVPASASAVHQTIERQG